MQKMFIGVVHDLNQMEMRWTSLLIGHEILHLSPIIKL